MLEQKKRCRPSRGADVGTHRHFSRRFGRRKTNLLKIDLHFEEKALVFSMAAARKKLLEKKRLSQVFFALRANNLILCKNIPMYGR